MISNAKYILARYITMLRFWQFYWLDDGEEKDTSLDVVSYSNNWWMGFNIDSHWSHLRAELLPGLSGFSRPAPLPALTILYYNPTHPPFTYITCKSCTWCNIPNMNAYLNAVSLLIIIGQVEELAGKTCPKASHHFLVQLSQPHLALSQAQMPCPELWIGR